MRACTHAHANKHTHTAVVPSYASRHASARERTHKCTNTQVSDEAEMAMAEEEDQGLMRVDFDPKTRT
jgi:hypothetical protein